MQKRSHIMAGKEFIISLVPRPNATQLRVDYITTTSSGIVIRSGYESIIIDAGEGHPPKCPPTPMRTP